MAIKINVQLTKAGITIPAGSMIKPSTSFPDDFIERDEAGNITGKKRILQMGFKHFPSKESFNTSPLEIGAVDQFDYGYGAEISDENWALLSGQNALLVVQGILKDWLESKLGVGTCEIINPYND
jgi:hypothetical protein